MNKRKKEIIITTLVLLLIVTVFFFNKFLQSSNDNGPIHGKIISEQTGSSSSKSGISHGLVKVKVTSGDHKGAILTLDNLIDDKTYRETTAKKGDSVLINITENADGSIKSAYIYELDRYETIYALILVFVLLLGIVGGIKGLKSVISLFLTGIVVLKILIPLIIAGFNPIITTILLCIGISIINLLIIGGKNKKTAAAIIGTIGGVLIASIIGIYVCNKLNLTGLTDEEIQMTIYIAQNSAFNFKGLLFSGILMGSLGAVMDVSMSIASSVAEVKESTPNTNIKLLFKSGMNIGRDIMGTMANTLILAYAGESMYLIMLIYSYNLPMYRILDQDAIASAILNSIAGSIGLILAVPITAIVTAILLNHSTFNKNIENQ